MNVAENRVLHRNMEKIEQNHEELAVAEFANMEKERNLLIEEKKKWEAEIKN
jgi:hypothetical protein